GHFELASPKFAAVLFGARKGLFFWSPMLLLAVGGFFVDHPLARRLRLAAAIIFLVDTWLIASWSDWQFGASFGHRGFTDGLAIAAVFLAAFFEWAARRPAPAASVGVVTTVLVALSSAQMIQYWLGILPVADTTW